METYHFLEKLFCLRKLVKYQGCYLYLDDVNKLFIVVHGKFATNTFLTLLCVNANDQCKHLSTAITFSF